MFFSGSGRPILYFPFSKKQETKRYCDVTDSGSEQFSSNSEKEACEPHLLKADQSTNASEPSNENYKDILIIQNELLKAFMSAQVTLQVQKMKTMQ